MMSLRKIRRKVKAVCTSAEDDDDDDYIIDIDESSPTSPRGGEKVQEHEGKLEEQQNSEKNEKSKIWSYFKFVVNNKYECVLCSGRLNYVGGSTSNFYRHMRKKHPSESVPSPKKGKLTTNETEKDIPNFKSPESKIWSYFKFVVNNKYECVLCSGRLNYVGGSTSNFYRHMRKKHPSESVPSPRKGKLTTNETEKDIPNFKSPDIDGPNCSRGVASVKEQKEKLEEQQGRSEEQQELETEQLKKSKKSSRIWSYFELVSKNKYQCTLCCFELNYFGGSNSNFYRHMRKKHPSEFSPSSKNPVEDSKVESINESGENERPKETASSKVDDTSYDASQPWRFFDILTGSATCRLCFRSLIYSSIADLAVLLDHLKSKHSISFGKYDSADFSIEIVDSDSSRRNSVSSHGAKNPGRKFEMFYTNFDDHSATCKMCSSLVSSNRKSLISHLYKEHRNYFSKKYPTFWHFSKFFSGDSSKSVSSKQNFSKLNFTGYDEGELNSTGYDEGEQNSTRYDEGEQFPTEQERDEAVNPETSMKRMSYSHNIVANFLNLDGGKAKCMFCSKRFSFSGDISILEQHILNDHKTVFIQKILDEMVFTDTNTGGQATNKHPIDKSTPSEQKNLLNKDLLSYFQTFENLRYECKICSEIFSLENEEGFDKLAEHVWFAHMSKTFRSIVFLQSFGISGINEERNSNNEMPAALKNKNKFRSTCLDEIKWVKPIGKLSKTWKYFLTPDPVLPYAKCRLCNHVLSIKSANISNLSRHLNTRHNDVLRSNLNMFYENRRMFCKNSKMKIVKKYTIKELRKSFQCRICLAHFSEWKSFRKHIRCNHKNYGCNKENRFAKTLFTKKMCAPNLSSTKKSSSVKCKLCGEYLLHFDRETCEKHMKENHTNAYNTGATFEKYKEGEMNTFSMNDQIVLKDDSHVSTFFVKSGSSHAKCKLCRKFISKTIHCRHRVPFIFSLSFGVRSTKKLKNSLTARGKSVPRKISSLIYCSSLNIVKNYCDICLKNPMSSNCRCIVNRRFVPKLMNTTQNQNVLCTQYLQDIPKSERQVHAVLFSINYFEKSCCLLCSEKISQCSNLLPCLDHFWLKHGTLVKNWNKMSKSVERRRLIDNIEYKTYFDTLVGLTDASEQHPVEANVISEQPAMILNFVCNNLASETENPVLCYEIADGNATSSLNITSENPTTSVDFNNENTSSNLVVIGDNNDKISLGVDIGNATSGLDVNDETHSSVLAITSENQVSNLASESEVINNVEPHHGTRRTTSLLWNYFTKVGPKVASCNACGRISNSATMFNLTRHLKNKHPKLAKLLQQERMKRMLSVSNSVTDDGDKILDKWMHFKKLSDEWAECNNCKRYISIRGGSTSNLIRHLKSNNCINKELDKELLCHLTNETKKNEPRRNCSSVWQYFRKVSADKAACSMCKHEISIKNNNISNLTRHLRTVHRVYIIPSSNFNPQVVGLQGAPDNSASVKYKYVVDEELNISQVPIEDPQTTVAEFDNSGTSNNFLIEETFPSYIAEEVVGVLDPIQKNDSIDDEAPETISLDALFKKIYRSPSWKYFTKLVNARVKCKLCDKTLSFKSSKCINNLTRHLKKKHASVIASTHSEAEADKEKCVIFVHDDKETEPPIKQVNKRPRTSYIWNYFIRSEHLKIVTCRICQQDLSYKSCPISNLRRHLTVKHPNVLNDIKVNSLSM